MQDTRIKKNSYAKDQDLKERINHFKNMHYNKRDSIPKIVIIYLILIIMSLITLYPMLNVLSIRITSYNVCYTKLLRKDYICSAIHQPALYSRSAVFYPMTSFG